MTTADPGTETPQPTPGWMVAVLGVLLLPLAAGAFILSFEQAWPVMLLGGWSTSTAWLGPVVLDITSAAGAVMHVVGLDRSVRGWGLTLLLGGTALSIMVNVAGHNVQTAGGARTQLPPEMTGWSLPEEWQPVNFFVSIAVPISVAMLVHAFGAVFKAWLATRPTADRTAATSPTHAAADTRPDPTVTAESAPDSTRTEPAARPDQPVQSGTDRARPNPTRLASDSPGDLRKSDESATRPDPIAQDPIGPDRQPTANPTEVDTRPDSQPTQPTDPTRPAADPTDSAEPTPHPTRPGSESDARPAESDLDDLVARARQLVESGQIRPTADAIRPALGVGQAKAREIRDALKSGQRHGLRAVS